MNTADREHVRALLRRDPVWCAYALADLEPPYAEHAAWFVGQEAVLLLYRGFDPPVLFAHGNPTEARRLAEGLPPGPVQISLQGIHRGLLSDHLEVPQPKAMWRMVHRMTEGLELETGPAARLSAHDLPAVTRLIDEHPDRPDAFHPALLEHGVYFGIWEGADLVAMAGTHVVAEREGVAAIGNVFTRPDRRGRGLARLATAAVVRELRRRGVETIVLNVAMDNQAAIRVYRRLGFWPFCGFYEGFGLWKPQPDSTHTRSA